MKMLLGVVAGLAVAILVPSGAARAVQMSVETSAPAGEASPPAALEPETPEDQPSEAADSPEDALSSRPSENTDYANAFSSLYRQLARYPGLKMKGIDWKAVGEELLPRAGSVKTEREFGLLCLDLVARLQDSHAVLMPGKARVPDPPLPQYGPGIACLIDDHGRPVVYAVAPNSQARRAGVQVGMTVVSVDGTSAERAIQECMDLTRRYIGFSSERRLRYAAARAFLLRMRQGEPITIEMRSVDGAGKRFELRTQSGVPTWHRLPVPISGINESADVSFARLEGNIGYIYVRRLQADLPKRLDRAVGELKGTSGLILDVRGNSGGGIDPGASVRNFNLDDGLEPLRPRYTGPMAVLLDEWCISAGEGWASWFITQHRARTFGATTSGASSAKTTIPVAGGLYKVMFPTRFRRGSLNRIIERQGLEPDVPVRARAADLAAGRDTVLETARQYLLSTASPDSRPADVGERP